jgi:ribosomal protein S6--L-glutamate ligase
VPVDERSELAHRTIQQARLRERDVVVLTINRGSVVIPTPHETMEILPGDVLLCFGKTFALKGFASPPRVKKTKKKKRDPERIAATGGPRVAPARKTLRVR